MNCKHSFIVKTKVIRMLDDFWRVRYTRCTKCYQQTSKLIEEVEVD